MKKLLAWALTALAVTLAPPAYAQQAVAYQNTVSNRVVNVPVTATNPLPVAGTADLGTAAQDALDDIVTNTAAIEDNTGAAVTSVPPTAPAPKGDATYTADFKNISTATDTALISNTSSQTGRLHRIFCTIDAADTLIFKSASTSLSATFRFPSTGGVLDWELSAYPYLVTATNEALNLTTSTTANVNCNYRYVKN